MKKIIILVATTLLFAASAFSQIEGRVTDAKGKGLPNVTITAAGADGEVVSTVTTAKTVNMSSKISIPESTRSR